MSMELINTQQLLDEKIVLTFQFHLDDDFVLGTEVVESDACWSPLGGPDHENCVLAAEETILDDGISIMQLTVDSSVGDHDDGLSSSDTREHTELSPNTRKSLEAELQELEAELISIRSELSEIDQGQSSSSDLSSSNSKRSSGAASYDDGTDAEQQEDEQEVTVLVSSANSSNIGRRGFSRSITPVFSGVVAELMKTKNAVSEKEKDLLLLHHDERVSSGSSYGYCCTDSEPEHEESPCHGITYNDLENRDWDGYTDNLKEIARDSVDVIISDQKKNRSSGRESHQMRRQLAQAQKSLGFPKPRIALAAQMEHRYSSAMTAEQIEEFARMQEEENTLGGGVLPRETKDFEKENPMQEVIVQQ